MEKRDLDELTEVPTQPSVETAPALKELLQIDPLELEDESLLLIKSTKRNYPAVERALRANHPYELPEVLAVPVEQGLQDYLDWVERCTDTEK